MIVGIVTFPDVIEISGNRIACEIWRGARYWGEVGCWCVTFFALLVLLVAETVQSSPCVRKAGQNRRFGVCWESFVPGGPVEPGVLGECCTAEGQMWLA